MIDASKEELCSICMAIVPKPHECEKGKEILARPPRELDAPYIHSDAVPTRDQSIRK